MMANLPYKIYAKKNKLYVVISYKSVDGKTKKKWLSTGLDVGTKKKEINVVAQKLTADFCKTLDNTGAKIVDEKPTGQHSISEFADYWLANVKLRVAPLTYQAYCSGANVFKAYFEDKNLTIETIKPIDIQSFYNSLTEKGLKATTVQNRHLCLHNMLEYAVKLDLIPFNPSDRVDLPKRKKHEATFYNKDEIYKLFEVFTDDRMELVVHIAAYYGLRRSEIIGLQWDAIDFENKTISVERKVMTIRGEDGAYYDVCTNELKTNSTRRKLPLLPHIERLLKEQKCKQEEMQKLKDNYCMDYLDFVCVDDLGKLISPTYVTTHFKYVVDKNGLRHLRFHDLRHTCASLLIAEHVPLKAVQDWLGHANFQTTANIYSHLDYSSRIESANAIANILGDTKSGLDMYSA